MDGLFENISFLIPIALLIAFRIIGGISKQDKKNQQKKPSGSSAEAGRNSADRAKEEIVRKFQEAWGINKPPAAPQKVPPKKPAAVKKKVPVKESNKYPVDAAALEQSAASSAAQSKTGQKAAAAPQYGQTVLLQNLPPLQQAVVWAEILGQPKGFMDIA